MSNTTSLLERQVVVVLLGNNKSGNSRDLKLIPSLKTSEISSPHLVPPCVCPLTFQKPRETGFSYLRKSRLGLRVLISCLFYVL